VAHLGRNEERRPGGLATPRVERQSPQPSVPLVALIDDMPGRGIDGVIDDLYVVRIPLVDPQQDRPFSVP